MASAQDSFRKSTAGTTSLLHPVAQRPEIIRPENISIQRPKQLKSSPSSPESNGALAAIGHDNAPCAPEPASPGSEALGDFRSLSKKQKFPADRRGASIEHLLQRRLGGPAAAERRRRLGAVG